MKVCVFLSAARALNRVNLEDYSLVFSSVGLTPTIRTNSGSLKKFGAYSDSDERDDLLEAQNEFRKVINEDKLGIVKGVRISRSMEDMMEANGLVLFSG